MGWGTGRVSRSPDRFVVDVSDDSLEKYKFNRTMPTMRPMTIKSKIGFIIHLAIMKKCKRCSFPLSGHWHQSSFHNALRNLQFFFDDVLFLAMGLSGFLGVVRYRSVTMV